MIWDAIARRHHYDVTVMLTLCLLEAQVIDITITHIAISDDTMAGHDGTTIPLGYQWDISQKWRDHPDVVTIHWSHLPSKPQLRVWMSVTLRCHKITYLFPHFTGHMIIYPCREKLHRISKFGPCLVPSMLCQNMSTSWHIHTPALLGLFV